MITNKAILNNWLVKNNANHHVNYLNPNVQVI